MSAPVVTIDIDPVPCVRIVTDSPAPSLQRVTPDGTRVPVRESARDQDGTWLDYEAPQATPLFYLDTSTGEGSRTVEVPDVGTWIVPCAEPLKAVPLLVDKEGAGEWAQAESRTQIDIPGGRPLVLSQRSSARSNSVSVWALSGDEYERLRDALRVDGVHFLSVSPRLWPWRDVTYVDVSDVKWTPTGNQVDQRWGVSFTLTEVDRPTTANDAGGTWDSAHRTWNEATEPWSAGGITWGSS